MLSENQDPVNVFWKHFFDAILGYDRLNILREDFKDYAVFLKAKDLKILSKERKEEILSQRMFILPAKRGADEMLMHTNLNKSNIVIQVNTDPNFVKYTFAPSTQSSCNERPDSAVKGHDNQESMPETPRSNATHKNDIDNALSAQNDNDNSANCQEEGAQRRTSRSMSNAQSLRDEDEDIEEMAAAENDIELSSKGL